MKYTGRAEGRVSRHPVMTRQHFQLIAEVLAYQRVAARILTADTAKGRIEEQARLLELDLTTYAFAGKLAETNPDFDRERFVDAAMGVSE
jgi:hypothetical protein